MKRPEQIFGVETDVLDELLADDFAALSGPTGSRSGWTGSLAALVRAARGPGEPGELAAEQRAVTAMAEAIAQDLAGGPQPRRNGLTVRRVVVAKTTAVVIGLSLATAAAAAGVTARLVVVADPGRPTRDEPIPVATAPATTAARTEPPGTTGCNRQCRPGAAGDPTAEATEPTLTSPPSAGDRSAHAETDPTADAPAPTVPGSAVEEIPEAPHPTTSTTPPPSTTVPSGPPANPGPPEGHGPPEGKGPPDGTGPPTDPGAVRGGSAPSTPPIAPVGD